MPSISQNNNIEQLQKALTLLTEHRAPLIGNLANFYNQHDVKVAGHPDINPFANPKTPALCSVGLNAEINGLKNNNNGTDNVLSLSERGLNFPKLEKNYLPPPLDRAILSEFARACNPTLVGKSQNLFLSLPDISSPTVRVSNRRSQTPVIYVNGILTRGAEDIAAMDLSSIFGRSTLVVHNDEETISPYGALKNDASKIPAYFKAALGGTNPSLTKLLEGRATQQLITVLTDLASNTTSHEQLTLVLHSQGNIIGLAALTELRTEHPEVLTKLKPRLMIISIGGVFNVFPDDLNVVEFRNNQDGAVGLPSEIIKEIAVLGDKLIPKALSPYVGYGERLNQPYELVKPPMFLSDSNDSNAHHLESYKLNYPSFVGLSFLRDPQPSKMTSSLSPVPSDAQRALTDDERKRFVDKFRDSVMNGEYTDTLFDEVLKRFVIDQKDKELAKKLISRGFPIGKYLPAKLGEIQSLVRSD